MVGTSTELFNQINQFRKDKIDKLKDKKEDYKRQTSKYCQQLEKYLSISARKCSTDENTSSGGGASNISLTNSVVSLAGIKQQLNFSNSISNSGATVAANVDNDDRQVKEETQQFYKKCLDYVNNIQEFEESWFQYFSESMIVFIKNWTTFYHEGYEKHVEYDPLFRKSQGNIQILRGNYEYFKLNSKKLIQQLLEDPDNHLNSYQVMSNDHSLLTSKQGYLYLFKKTLGQASWTKYFCRYYKEDKKFEILLYNQLSSNHHHHSSRNNNNRNNFETYFIINCIKSINDKLDKRFIFDLICKSPSNLLTSSSSSSSKDQSAKDQQQQQQILTFQALSNDDFKSWFSIMEGKDIPKSQRMSNDPIYILDNNGLKFIQKCISMLETEKRINEEGIYRRNGVSHKITQFIEKYCENINVNHKAKTSSTSSNNINANSGFSSGSGGGGGGFSSNNSSNNDSDDTDTCTITSALKYFLIHCNEPLMTFKYNGDFLKTVRIDNLSDRLVEINYLLEKLPPINFSVLKILMKHLFTISKSSKSNKMTISNLSTCFGPTVFRTEQECVTNLYNIKFYSEIIELLIIYHEKIFEKNFKEIVKNNKDFILLQPVTSSSSTQSLSSIAAAPIVVVSKVSLFLSFFLSCFLKDSVSFSQRHHQHQQQQNNNYHL